MTSVRWLPQMGGLLLSAAVLASCHPHQPTVQSEVPADQWTSYGRDYSEQRFSPLDDISAGNVGTLGVAWTYDMREGRGVEATPLVVNGTMYVTSAWSVVYALDARTGKELWVFDPAVDKAVGAKACCDVVNRGVA
ncbi:MAG: PQQ-binding-like beta-propeller repeat protein, partial [Sphingobium sp.]